MAHNENFPLEEMRSILLSMHSYILFSVPVNFIIVLCCAEHTQDKQVHRDDEYYEADNDNDHDDGAH